MPVSADDAALVLAVRDGDHHAFASLFERWADRCHDIARRIVHDDGIAAEVAQETFLVAWQQLDSLRDPAAFGGWVLRTARNKALNRLEHERRATPTDAGTETGPFERGDGSDPAMDLEVAMTAADHRELVAAATAVLGEREASVLDLHLRHGLSAAEIADELEITANNAHQLLFRTKKRLAAGIRAWILVRGGRVSCPALGATLEAEGITGFDRAAADAIDRHVAGCEACADRQASLLGPAALFAAAPVVAMSDTVRASVVAGLRAAGVPVGPKADVPTADAEADPAAVEEFWSEADEAGEVPPGRHRRRLAAAALVVLLIAGIAAVATTGGDAGDAGDEVAAAGTTTTADDEPDGAPEDASSTTVVALPGPGQTTTTAAAPTQPRAGDGDPTGTGPGEGSPTTSAPPAPVGTGQPTATLAPPPLAPATTTTTRPPTTTTAPPAPRVDGFTATTAALPGGACPAGQWATKLAWSTTNATAVRISANTVGTLSGLAPDGTRVVCRSTLGAPPGGWSLTATGPGGSADASA